MLDSTQEEIDAVVAYMSLQAPDLTVEFCQKMYAENVVDHRHEVWDVHTNQDRWWVVTNPTNLYSQDQFPNMDLALTFHVGLCLRIPRGDKRALAELHVEPFVACWRALSEATQALRHAEEVADYQAIGVRCREALLAFADAAQTVMPWSGPEIERPKRADMKAWADHICSVALPGPSHENRRALFKMLLDGAWKFTNWLTHAKGSTWHDAETAVSTTEHATGLCTTTLIMRLRRVPESCPACGSHRLSPERGAFEGVEGEYERPVCMKCDWAGELVLIEAVPSTPVADRADSDATVAASQSECYVPPKKPLRSMLRPK